jgi:hypothetical protein
MKKVSLDSMCWLCPRIYRRDNLVTQDAFGRQEMPPCMAAKATQQANVVVWWSRCCRLVVPMLSR